MSKQKVCIVGSGNWGSAIARIVGYNCARHDDFDTEVRPRPQPRHTLTPSPAPTPSHTPAPRASAIRTPPSLARPPRAPPARPPSAPPSAPQVNMWVYEEMIEGKKLTEIINETHVNVKYLPDAKLPENVVAVPDLKDAAKGATLLIFVLPHQFLGRLGPQIKEAGCDPKCRALSLIKGIEFEEGKPKLISHMIHEAVGMNTSVLMGANVANEVAKDEFCEATIGSLNDPEAPAIWKKVFNTAVFKINTVDDVPGVELCGALKNVVAIGAGFCDGLGFGGNTKAAIVRIG